MDAENAAHKLINLTSNLSSSLPENEKYLDTIRRILGYNLRNDRQDISLTKLQPAELEFSASREQIQEFRKYAVSRLPKKDKYLVQRIQENDIVPAIGVQIGDVRLPVNPIETSEEFRWSQKRGEQIGPFLSEEGRSIWFDLYYYEDKLTVRSQSDGLSYFLFSRAKTNHWLDAFTHSQTVSLKAGHVWISGKLFANTVGNDEYVGFNIEGGSFSLSNEKNWDGQYLNFKGNFTGQLTIQLVQPEANAPAVEGCIAAQSIVFQYPKEVTFKWKNGILIGIAADDGRFTGYGNELIFTNFHTSVEYQSGLNHIFIPCEVEPTIWEADFSQSHIFNADGKADIKKAFWALPIVRVSNPVTLGEPENNGGWGLRLASELSAKWLGSDEQQPDAILNDILLLLYPQALFLYSENTQIDITSVNEIKQDFSCWQISSENPARIPLSLSYRNNFLLVYYCHATEGETLLVGCLGQMQPDRPIFAEGSRISMKDLSGWVIFQAQAEEIKIGALLANPEALRHPTKPLALKNALMVVSQPTGLVLEGTLSTVNRNSIGKGKITLLQGLLRWKPILPDPYVSNLLPGLSIDRSSKFSSILFAQTSWEQPDKPVVTFQGDLVLSAGIGIAPASDPSVKSVPIRLDGRTLEEIKKNGINGKQREEKNRIDGFFDQIEKSLSGWKLLDVSTNMDLIGVCITPSLFGRRDTKFTALARVNQQSVNNTLIIKDLAVNTPLSAVHVFMVPQVQWEPVRTLPEDQNIAALGWFPENLSSATDGGATRLIGINQELSPIIPDVVVRQIRESFTKGNQAAALTTLSFGLKAVVQLTPKNTPTRNADSFDIVQPTFPKRQMKGGVQINLMAESGNPKSDNRSPGFEGFMVQTLNGYELFTGTELGLSVLGATKAPDTSVETQFNKEFAQGGTAPFVPVTRFDLSGYGASNFSEWDNPGALAQIGKVQFKIMVGRTAFEVVKFVSKIYPWGMTVTRSVTIERRSGGGVIRKDSGWQATQAGIFDFRTDVLPQPYIFRPGMFRGCFKTKNIRPASNNIIQFIDPNPLPDPTPDIDPSTIENSVELAPVYFDADVELDGQNGRVFAKGILGFIQLSPKGKTLSAAAFRKLIADQGAIGGPIDTILNVGSSGFRFRATRFEVDVTDNGGAPNFVGVVRGQPILPNNGSWSVVKMAAPGNTSDPQEAMSADVSRGTPLFIENSWNPPSGNLMNISGPAGPYRFADPSDLFAAQPRFDYGFMQNTGSQAFLFRRPVIVSGTNEISSSLKPAFADPFAMLTSKGVFPPVANAIEFPTANYKLLIQSGTGKLRLNTPVNLNNLRVPLVVVQDGVDQIAIEYDQSNLRINLNFDDWNIELDNFFIWTSLLGISKFYGTRFSLRAGNAQQAKLVDVKSLLKPDIQDALNFLPGMGSPANIGDIDLGMTNAKHEVKVHTGFETPNLIPKPLGEKVKLKLKGSAGVDSVLDTTMPGGWMAFFGAKVGGELQGKIPVVGIVFVVLGLELGAALRSTVSPTAPSATGSTSSSVTPIKFKSLEIAAYVGIGIGGNIGPFSAQAFLAAGLVFVYEDDTAKFGGLVMLEAEVDLAIVSVGISAELKGVYYKGDDPGTPTIETDVSLIDASGQVAINISIFLVINIKASYEYQTTVKP
ncbi:MAG: hypothetical protein GPJ10_18855 [Microcystis aeruginosa L211-07]|nr:hypothetical protein [Microcystis aeruginosa L211-07]